MAVWRRLASGITMICLMLPVPVWAMAGKPVKPIMPVVSKAELASQLKSEFKLPDDFIKAALDKAKFSPSVIRRIRMPYEAKPYAKYRPLFVNTTLTRQGKDYLKKHKGIFTKAMDKHGVQPGIIAAILGIETHYGRSRGRDRVLDSLYTLASGYPRRAAFFRKELGHFLTLCREEGVKPHLPLGSYAGAFGTTQFIPSSYRMYAVDADGDGKRDVWESPRDIIFSVANYFRRHGWDASRPIAHWLPKLPRHRLLREAKKQGIQKWYRLAQLRKAGLPRPPCGWKDDDRVTLVELKTKRGNKTALVHYNFFVITRWNRSYNYAMAATELASLLGCKQCASRK